MKILFANLPDDELVKYYQAGNQEAFRELLSRHQERVFKYIYLIVRNESLANDLFQDTFVKVVTFIKQYRYIENGHFLSWVIRIAHNLIMDYYRKNQPEVSIHQPDHPYDLLNNIRLSDPSAEDDLIQRQLVNNIRELIKYLPDLQQEVVHLRYYEDLSFREIADKTGVSINTALGRMRYALINLRKLADESLSI
ncbi:RNA polymerase sigma factor [Microbacter margulisiae]|uniref:RNA polymerase sigma-70 factor (ECF subfamily) n=1 Tax=Microbacter margulisiae TaxID=1350067 RepID=A0A7W5H2M5_9PORP|nr:sigma-70 family RNA polymerase sigma factor [Microbacter margulisiae]MBB3187925.1 RNA polymerase sigma-70 factor (ECF subfamily) [Microbacter margulisiae]